MQTPVIEPFLLEKGDTVEALLRRYNLYEDSKNSYLETRTPICESPYFWCAFNARLEGKVIGISGIYVHPTSTVATMIGVAVSAEYRDQEYARILHDYCLMAMKQQPAKREVKVVTWEVPDQTPIRAFVESLNYRWYATYTTRGTIGYERFVR
jgi:N-acetylglutamate synthase-like GNAT family acetyltransferase